MKEEDIQIIKQIITERNLKSNAYRRFKTAINKYLEFHQYKKTMYQLIHEALNEQNAGILQQKQKLYQYLISFRVYLADNVAPSTLKTYTVTLNGIYRHYGVLIPELPPFKIRQEKPLCYNDLPTHEDIKKAVSISQSDMRALILFQSSSGTSLHESLTITIRMFFEACGIKEVDNHSIPYYLNHLKQKKELIPLFSLERVKTNKYYYTCCSNEATTAIIDWLTNRTALKLDDKIWPKNKNKYTQKYAAINKQLKMGYHGRKYSKFRSHTMRKFHASNLGGGTELIDELQGRGKSQVHEAYIKDKPAEIKQKYMKYMNNILINETSYDDKIDSQIQEEDSITNHIHSLDSNDVLVKLIQDLTKRISVLEYKMEQMEVG